MAHPDGVGLFSGNLDGKLLIRRIRAGGIGSPLVMMIFSAIALMMILTPLNT